MFFASPTFTLIHVLISLVGIGSGFVILYGLLSGRWYARWTALFLTTTLATSVTGFLFPVHQFMPSHAIGILSLLLLAVSIPALYVYHLEGGWRKAYIITALMAQYFNVFVLIVQMFRRIPLLKEAAPTQSEPAFVIAQLSVLVLFLILGTLAVTRSRNQVLRPA